MKQIHLLIEYTYTIDILYKTYNFSFSSSISSNHNISYDFIEYSCIISFDNDLLNFNMSETKNITISIQNNGLLNDTYLIPECYHHGWYVGQSQTIINVVPNEIVYINTSITAPDLEFGNITRIIQLNITSISNMSFISKLSLAVRMNNNTNISANSQIQYYFTANATQHINISLNNRGNIIENISIDIVGFPLEWYEYQIPQYILVEPFSQVNLIITLIPSMYSNAGSYPYSIIISSFSKEVYYQSNEIYLLEYYSISIFGELSKYAKTNEIVTFTFSVENNGNTDCNIIVVYDDGLEGPQQVLALKDEVAPFLCSIRTPQFLLFNDEIDRGFEFIYGDFILLETRLKIVILETSDLNISVRNVSLIDVGKNQMITLSLRNDGNIEESVNITLEGVEGLHFSPSSFKSIFIRMREDFELETTISITNDINYVNSSFPISISIDSVVIKELKISTSSVFHEVIINGDPFITHDDGINTIMFDIENNGTAIEEFTYFVHSPIGWIVNVHSPVLALNPGSLSNVTIIIVQLDDEPKYGEIKVRLFGELGIEFIFTTPPSPLIEIEADFYSTRDLIAFKTNCESCENVTWNINGQNYYNENITYQFETAGEKIIHLYLRSQDGIQSHYTYSIEIINREPVSIFSYVKEDGMVRFDGSYSNDPDGEIIKYYWSIEDVSFDGSMISYVFNNPGTYIVELTVVDDFGSTNTSIQIIEITEEESLKGFESKNEGYLGYIIFFFVITIISMIFLTRKSVDRNKEGKNSDTVQIPSSIQDEYPNEEIIEILNDGTSEPAIINNEFKPPKDYK